MWEDEIEKNCACLERPRRDEEKPLNTQRLPAPLHTSTDINLLEKDVILMYFRSSDVGGECLETDASSSKSDVVIKAQVVFLKF